MAIDNDADKRCLRDEVAYVVQPDSTDIKALRSQNVHEPDG